jgi:hypothetical protein
VLTFALSDSAESTIAIIAIWFIGFPAFVTALILFALAQVQGEARANRERRRFRR